MCGKESLNTHRNRKSFCNIKCSSDYKYKVFVDNWLANNENFIKGKETISNHIRRYLHETFNSKCQKCGWSEINKKTGKIPLTINHIDGNYENNLRSNLELICPNCHSLTENYGALNKGKGRKNRLEKINNRGLSSNG